MNKAIVTAAVAVAIFIAATGATEARAIHDVSIWTNWNDAVFVSNSGPFWVKVTLRITEYHRYSWNRTDYVTHWVAPYDSKFVGYTGWCGGDIYNVRYCIVRARY